MNRIEQLIPLEHTLEYAMGHMQSLLDDKLMNLAEEQAGSLIDLANDDDRWVEASVLTTREFGFYYLGIDYVDEPELKEVVVRAAKLALQVVGDVAPTKPPINIADYLAEKIGGVEDPGERLRSEVQVYLGERPAVDAFVEYYAAELGAPQNYSLQAQTVCGMVFMLCEREIAEQYVTARFEVLTPEEFVG